MSNFEQEILNSSTIETKQDWRKDLAIAKFEYQKQKDKQKADEKRAEILNQQKAMRNEQLKNIAFTTLKVGGKLLFIAMKITLIIAIAPFVIGGLFLTGFLKGLCK